MSLYGEPRGELPSDGGAVALLEGVVLDEPGIYRFAFTSKDGTISGTSNPIRVVEAPEATDKPTFSGRVEEKETRHEISSETPLTAGAASRQLAGDGAIRCQP